MSSNWTVILAYYNEASYIVDTLHSLIAQTVQDFFLILVDNGSTDNTTDICRRVMREYPHITTNFVHEPQPGQSAAFAAGLKYVLTPFVAFCDADTYYPRSYLAEAERRYTRSHDVVAVLAHYLPRHCSTWRVFLSRWHQLTAARLFPRQCHTGCAGQTFRVDALRKAGGYSVELWPFVLHDHELIHRVLKHGRGIYDARVWCIPSERRTNTSLVSWTMWEQILYLLIPFAAKDWYFYQFLAKRFMNRSLYASALRNRNW